MNEELLRNVFGNNEDLIKEFAKIDAYRFKYTPEAQEMYGEERGVDNKDNVGVMAQELEENPVTSSVVSEDENGYKMLDTRKLAAADTAVLSDVCKRLLAIEEKLGMRGE